MSDKPRYRVRCWDCGGEGYSGHDCGEDSCCCLYPEDNMVCDTCDGKGYYDTLEPPTDPDSEYWSLEDDPEPISTPAGGAS
jgi:hypothetical protein